MSSIRERAAALNLAEKLCARPEASTKPVQGWSSWSVWSSLISVLRSTVPVKTRRVHLKSHSDCFLGSQAADVLQEHVAHVRGLEGASVSRDKVVSVCQALLDCGVFEAVGTKVFGKDKKQDLFQDSHSALYRFVDTCSPSADQLEQGALVNGIHKLFCTTPLVRPGEPDPAGPHAVQISAPPDARMSSGLTVEPQMKNLSPNRAKTDSLLPQSLVDKVWQEQTLLRLLNLVELPLLEGVLQYIQSPSPPPSSALVQTNPDLLCSTNHMDRQILQAFRDCQCGEDEWIRAALACLDFLPDQLTEELSRGLPHRFLKDDGGGDQDPAGGEDCRRGSSAARCKLLLYDTLVKHYGKAGRTSLLPHDMSHVYRAITQLLVGARLNQALEALQLSLKLLPLRCRDELRHLLTFMSLAADSDQVRVDQEVENRLAVRRSFSRAILHSKTLSRDQEDLLLVFMLSNNQEIFKIPGALHKQVSEKLACLAQRQQPDVTGSAFCPQASSSSTTQPELWSLLSSIHRDPRTPSRERRRLLRQFYQAHPHIFFQYFGDSAHSVFS